MGPLKGIRIVEMAGLAPGPYCAMLLADMGADIIRVERPGGTRPGANDRLSLLNRNRRTLVIDLKSLHGVAVVARLAGNADALIEGFRPGVMERLGLGPDVCLMANPRLVYGRMTGWGQDGPLAGAPGHDLNYIALSGVLHSIGRKGEPPVIPLNIVGDFAGGGMLLAIGMLSAIIEAMRLGQGQVVDAAMVDGAASLMTFMHGLRAQGAWRDERGENQLDGASPWYQVYETSDGQYISIANVEKKFHDELLRITGLDKENLPGQHDRKNWPRLQARFAELFRSKTRAEWCALLEGSETCFAPVLSIPEAMAHPHNRARKAFMEVDGVTQPSPAPRFSRSQPDVTSLPDVPGTDPESLLGGWGFSGAEVAELRRQGAFG
jgi:alpha-methylacyl-CoA racemase